MYQKSSHETLCLDQKKRNSDYSTAEEFDLFLKRLTSFFFNHITVGICFVWIIVHPYFLQHLAFIFINCWALNYLPAWHWQQHRTSCLLVYIGHFYKEGILQVLFPSSWSPEMLCNTWISVDYICSHMCHLCDPQ